MLNPLLLCVEKDPALARLLARTFADTGFRVAGQPDPEAAVLQAKVERPDVVLLDLGGADINAPALIASMNEVVDAPLVVIAETSLPEHSYSGVLAGVFDIVFMPFDPDDLETCVRFAAGHPPQSPGGPGMPPIGDATIDLQMRTVSREGFVPFSFTEWRLLEALAAAAGEPVLHRELLASVWGHRFASDMDLLRFWMNRLREKVSLGDFHGVGYALVADR